MARHHHEQRRRDPSAIAGAAQAPPALQQERLLAIPRAGRHHHRAGPEAPPPLLAFRLRRFVDRLVELEVAGDCIRRPRELRHPRRVGCRLRDDDVERSHRGGDQAAVLEAARQRLLREPRVDDRHRHAALARGMHQVGPDLGLHDQAEERPLHVEETADAERQVVRQIALPQSRTEIPEQFPAGGAPGRRGMGEEDRCLGIPGCQPAQQRRRGRGLADRHRMDPDRAAALSLRPAEAEALAPMQPVFGLADAAIEQVDQREREQDDPAGRIEMAQHDVGCVRPRRPQAAAGAAAAIRFRTAALRPATPRGSPA